MGHQPVWFVYRVMSRSLIALAATALVVLLATSVVYVPGDGGAWRDGQYLGPGLHFKAPLAEIARYESTSSPLKVSQPIRDFQDALHTFQISVDFRWDHHRLSRDALDPRTLEDRFLELVPELNGRFGVATLQASVRQALPALLARLPVHVLRVEATYAGQVFEPLLGADRPTGERVVFVGMDGLDWVLLDRLIAQGKCPTFARMKRTGAWGDLVSHQPLLSPLIWTTIATGRRPEIHGVLDFVATDPATGQDTPVTNRFRQVHAIWNILSYLQRRVDVVNWWATYPAEPIRGTMVTERLFYQLFGIRPSLDDPRNVFPAEALQQVLPLLVQADDVGHDEVRQFANLSTEEFDQAVEEAKLAENPYDNRVQHLRKILAVTRGVFNIGSWLLANDPADLLALYIEGTDTTGHRFAHFLPPKLNWVDAEDYRRYRDTMSLFYELVDRELGELIESSPADTTWIVASDHGFFTGRARPSVPPDDFTVGAPQWHRMVGVLLAAGPNVRAGKLPHADMHDLGRTLLWLLGAPISRQLEGRELVDLMQDTWVAEHPPVYVDNYENLPRTWLTQSPETADDSVQQARLKELAALGYLAGKGNSTPVPSPPARIETEPDLVARPSEPYNRGKLAARRGDLEEAEGSFLEALEADPGFAIAMTSLAAVYRRQGRHDESLRYLLRALETGSEMLRPTILLDFVYAAEAAGRLERALGALELMQERWGEASSYDTARGLALKMLRRPSEAAASYRAALVKDPADAVATEELLALAGESQNVEEILERHLRAVRNDLKKLNDFAVVCLRQRRPDWAERALQGVLESDPTNAGVLSNLAVAQQLQGRLEDAADTLERAVQARPNDGSLRFNYGAMQAALGRDREALDQFAEVERLGISGPRLFAAKGKVLFRLNRVDEARAVLLEGARRFPDHEEIRALLEALTDQG